MQFELTKICRKFRISVLNESDLSIYPEYQRDRLKVAVACVTNARNTLHEFRDFLKDDKYREWNAKQSAANRN